MYLIKTQRDWLLQHAELADKEEGIWKCKETGKQILIADVGRSIWIRPFTGGSGEVRMVTHLVCGGCNPEATPPRTGSPIYEDELVEIL